MCYSHESTFVSHDVCLEIIGKKETRKRGISLTHHQIGRQRSTWVSRYHVRSCVKPPSQGHIRGASPLKTNKLPPPFSVSLYQAPHTPCRQNDTFIFQSWNQSSSLNISVPSTRIALRQNSGSAPTPQHLCNAFARSRLTGITVDSDGARAEIRRCPLRFARRDSGPGNPFNRVHAACVIGASLDEAMGAGYTGRKRHTMRPRGC